MVIINNLVLRYSASSMLHTRMCTLCGALRFLLSEQAVFVFARKAHSTTVYHY